MYCVQFYLLGLSLTILQKEYKTEQLHTHTHPRTLSLRAASIQKRKKKKGLSRVSQGL